MKWEKLCAAKDVGGREFRDLHLFNIALLTKMGWRLMTDHKSLVCKILKAKYFPDSVFLSANLGRNPSFTWTSIHASQDLLKRGTRWKVGEGNQINIWRNPWIKDDNNFYVRTSCLVWRKIWRFNLANMERKEYLLVEWTMSHSNGSCLL